MSPRFRLFSSMCAGAAVMGGSGLGFYATTPPKAGTETVLPQAAMPAGADDGLTLADLTGPAVIHCTGCGPALADRQMAADMAGWDGMDDPAVRDYAAQEELVPASYAEPPPTPATQTLPVSIEGDWQPVRMAQAPNSKTPAEEAPADAAVPD